MRRQLHGAGPTAGRGRMCVPPRRPAFAACQQLAASNPGHAHGRLSLLPDPPPALPPLLCSLHCHLTPRAGLQVLEDPRFELVLGAPPRFGLVCFRLRGSDAANAALLDSVNASGGLGLGWLPACRRACKEGRRGLSGRRLKMPRCGSCAAAVQEPPGAAKQPGSVGLHAITRGQPMQYAWTVVPCAQAPPSCPTPPWLVAT